MQNFHKIFFLFSKCETLSCITYRQLSVFSKYTPISSLSINKLTGNEKTISRKEFLENSLISFSQNRLKSFSGHRKKSKSSEYESGSDSDSDYDDTPQEFQHGSKVVQIQTDSLRCDLVLKNGLGISRNKLEMYFYEGRIRINGSKIMKKSISVKVGEEVDVIKNFDEENPDLLHVGRVEILKAKPSGDFILLTIRKFKNLLIENYKQDPWQEKLPEKEESEEEEDKDNTSGNKK